MQCRILGGFAFLWLSRTSRISFRKTCCFILKQAYIQLRDIFLFCRQLALKALNERLKRVEDQSAWPNMDDDDEESSKADTPLLPEKSRDVLTSGKASSQESSLITFEDAPSQL